MSFVVIEGVNLKAVFSFVVLVSRILVSIVSLSLGRSACLLSPKML